jgi:hypothetical protein
MIRIGKSVDAGVVSVSDQCWLSSRLPPRRRTWAPVLCPFSRYRRAVPDLSSTERHLRAAQAHDEAAERHEEAAAFWSAQGDEEKAELERRNARIERNAARLERDRAALAEREDATK